MTVLNDQFLHVLTRRYADARGRARRRDYWTFIALGTAASLGISLISMKFVTTPAGPTLNALNILITAGLIIPSVAITARRLHDTGRSGWTQLLLLLPIVGLLILMIFLIQDGQHSHNTYGPNPKPDSRPSI